MKRPIFTNGEVYHLYNRGVEKRKTFLNNKDYLRFIHDLFEFNDQSPVLNINYRFKNKKSEYMEVGLPYIQKREPRKLLIEILAFCLMPNHYHLLVRQKVEGGITDFMRKLGTGYTNYFNQKYERVGSLFQGKFKSVLVQKDAHFFHIPYYIHANPLDLILPNWKEREIKNYKNAVQFLESYRWSSLLDYIGKKNFPSVTQRESLEKIYGEPQHHRKGIMKWLEEMDLESIEQSLLEK